MIDRTSIIRLNELHDDDLPAEIQRNPDLQHLISYLRTITPPEIDVWKESVRQSRLHDWDDADEEEEEVDPLAEKDNEQEDDGTIED